MPRVPIEGTKRLSGRNFYFGFKTGFSEKLGFEIRLKTDKKVVSFLLDTVDVLAVRPTGFGKSLIFQAFVMASKMESNDHATAMVYIPLNCITEKLHI